MIFLRQKHYSNSRGNSNTPRNHNINRNNRATRNHNQRASRNANNSSNAVSNSNTNRRSLASSLTSLDFMRTITVNERLASIGGLFGALSIIITGALLYAIFTAKSQDKWYYIIAVLINISLLILLMIAAILFDRFYLKKFSNRRRCHTGRENTTNNTQNNDRIIHINPSFYANQTNFITQQTLLTNISNLAHCNENILNSVDCLNVRINNDVPPQYPGYLDQQVNENSSSRNNSSLMSSSNFKSAVPANANINTISNEVSNQANLNRNPPYCPETSIVNNFNLINATFGEASTKQILPPNYFDLYPTSDININDLNSLPPLFAGSLPMSSLTPINNADLK